MSMYRYEMYANFMYTEELTYEELMQKEKSVTADFSSYLQNIGAAHIDFRPLGDALYAQCILAQHDASAFEEISEKAAQIAGKKMEGRILFFGQDLSRLYTFFFADEECCGGRLSLPRPKEGLAKQSPSLVYASSKDRKN